MWGLYKPNPGVATKIPLHYSTIPENRATPYFKKAAGVSAQPRAGDLEAMKELIIKPGPCLRRQALTALLKHSPVMFEAELGASQASLGGFMRPVW